MLKVLQRIVQEVNSSHNLLSALNTCVCRIRQAVDTESCSIFLIDQRHHQYVLVATDGLNPKAINIVRFGLSEGLVGLVGEKAEPVNIDNAREHPRYFHSPLVEEDRFMAFLGVPIIHHRRLMGVLIIQQEDPRRFDESEEAFLVTISAQLAAIIAHAETTHELENIFEIEKQKKKKKKRKNSEYQGIPCVPGVGIGQAVVVYPLADLSAVRDNLPEDIQKEILLFQQALVDTRSEIKAMIDRMSHTLSKSEMALFDVYLQIVDDNSLTREVIEQIENGNWAQGALRSVILDHVRQFENMEDEYLRERADDLRDLGRRILAHLQAHEKAQTSFPKKIIIIGDEVNAGSLVEIPEDSELIGIVSARGSKNSHVAILARAMNIPTVMGVKGLDVSDLNGQEIIVDGYYGQIYIAPSSRLRKEYLALAQEEKELDADLNELRDLPACTPDGHNIMLFINTGLNENAGLSLSVGAEGVGLFRTEVPFMMRDSFPSEDQQRIIYRQLLNAFAPRPVIMRTLDVGGDKVLPYFPITETNPYLGWRGIRVTLDHPEVFLVQIRAMLKANHGLNNLRILLPMITHVGEVDDSIRLIKKAYKELLEEGFDIAFPPIGIMIEVPSAVFQARAICTRVDFLSIGSNDLTQYLLAVDRNNARVSDLYDALHPAVLTCLMQVLDAARQEGKPVSICGEMAGDPASVILLLAMGFETLSINSIALPRIKWVIRNFSRKRARSILNEVMIMEDPITIRLHLEQALEQAGLGGLVRAGK